MRACLWSRLASRILMPLAEFAVADADALYAGVQSIDWSEHLAVDGTFAVDAVGSTHGITHTQFTALRVKDAIVDQFRDEHRRPAERRYRTTVGAHESRAAPRQGDRRLDLSGTPLHQRG